MRTTKPFDRVRRLGLMLEGVEEGTSYGAPALKVRGKMFACVAINKSAEPDTLAVRMSFLERDLRLKAEPDVYYLQPHYVNFPCVLARLSKLSDEALRDLLETGWQFGRSVRGRAATKRRRG